MSNTLLKSCFAALALVVGALWCKAEVPLPSDYTPLTWIQSTGTQWIDTEIPASKTLQAEADVVFDDYTGDWNFGYQDDDEADWRLFNYSKGMYFDCGSARATAGKLTLGTRYLLEFGVANKKVFAKATYQATGEEATKTEVASSGDPQPSNVKALGASMRLFSFKLTDGGELKRDFVPCRKNGEVGLWDKVEGVFYENKGTGKFFGGPAVADPEAVQLPQFISHRGESVDRPENSMAAFQLAFERGVDGVECDVYATTDGKGAIIHDGTTKRTAGSDVNLTVTACTWDQLKDVKIGAFGKWVGSDYENETIPLLDDYLGLLALNDTTKCVIELKSSDNSLIDVVVQAIQAQPLATPERIVFISFHTALVEAIRTALPTYEAWLLLSEGTYTGADLASRATSCLATGVDVRYLANVTEEDVAFVKSAGFTYAVWTCDDVEIAYAQFERGAQAITTDTGKALKDAIVPFIEARNNWNEIFDPSQPRGAKLWDVGDYVQDGLVGHFDGIRNQGASASHDSKSATWQNLVEGNPSASFALANVAGGSWMGNGYAFNGGCYAQVDEPGLTLGDNCTIQLATDVDYSIQPLGGWPNFLALPDDFCIFLNNVEARSSTLNWKTEPYGESKNTRRPVINGWAGKSITAILDSDGKYFTQTAELGEKVVRGDTKPFSAACFTWGGSANVPAKRYSIGTVHAVRFYNRALTPAEVAQNFKVDEIRFRGNGVNVIVESNTAGLDDASGSGSYTVNGTHTFAPPVSVTQGECTWAPTGYKLEGWDGVKRTWDLLWSSSDLEYVYTNCAARAKVRLTWNWRLKRGVKRIDADDYVQAGLVQQFDGIRNAGLGQPHAAEATVWKNLSPAHGDATLVVRDGAKQGAWKGRGYEFGGGDYFKLDVPMTLERQATIQVASDYYEGAQFVLHPHLFGNADDRLNLYSRWTAGDTGENRGDRIDFKADATTKLDAASRSFLQPWHGRILNALLDYNRSSLGQDATLDWRKGGYGGADVGRCEYFIGTGGSKNSDKAIRMLVGRVYAVRVYDRPLTADELAHNLEIDGVRFHTGASRFTGTDLVEVASEPAVLADEDLGAWLLRGEVSKTFAVPSTLSLPGADYHCSGYRLETWNATTRMWENAQVVEGSSTCTLQGSSGAANRRLTWLLTCDNALRTAADYDVGDYVQQGLVGHYDGIRNRGADIPHAATGVIWQDLSCRDNMMVVSSDELYRGWLENGFGFKEDGYFMMQESISLGLEHTEQCVLDVDTTKSKVANPNYIVINSDSGIFSSNTGNTLQWKYDTWGGTPRATCSNWSGQYINSVIDANTVSLFEGTTRSSGSTRNKKVACDGYRWSIGAPGTMKAADIAKRVMQGSYFAARFYNRALTDAELAQNRKVDEIRYRGNFANYRNVEVKSEQPFEGATAKPDQPDGNYEVVGEWTFTAPKYVFEDEGGTKTRYPTCTVSTYHNGEWTRPVKCGDHYTYKAGGDPVRVTWTWNSPGLVLLIQ